MCKKMDVCVVEVEDPKVEDPLLRWIEFIFATAWKELDLSQRSTFKLCG